MDIILKQIIHLFCEKNVKPILEYIFFLMLWALVHKCESNIKDVSCEEHWTTIKSNARFHGGCPCIQCLLP